MAFLVVQLSDIHLQLDTDPIFAKVNNIAEAIAAEAGTSASHIVLMLSGDLADKGQATQFALAKTLVTRILSQVASKCPAAVLKLLAIPGNHDLDLSGDQAARDSILSTLTQPETPAASIAEIALAPLAAYFAFSSALIGPTDSLLMSQPYYLPVDIDAGNGRLVRFHLFNSAWMSKRKELANSLTFPINEIRPPESPEPHYAIAAIHHPFNWFRQPDTMRPLQHSLEGLSDLILTGHEHSPDSYQKQAPDNTSQGYLLGGALYDPASPEYSTFNIIRLDFDAQSQTVIKYSWAREGYYKHATAPIAQQLGMNIGRVDRRYVLTTTFDDFLDGSELPLLHDKKSALKLSDLYTYPDLRELDTAVGPDMWKRIKVGNIVETLLGSFHTLVTGAEKSGKSSLLKTLFRDLQRLAKVPLFVTAADLRTAKTDSALRKVMSKAIRQQYKKLAGEQYEQLDRARKVLLIDDWDTVELQHDDATFVMQFLTGHFSNIIATATDSFDFEDATSTTRLFKRFDICEFGHVRLKHLATKWLQLGASQEEHGDIPKEVDRLCKKIEHALRTNAIPHHPWILVVLLKRVDTFDDTSARNGSYGHLYNAVITAALYRSKLSSVDITTKYTYLSNLAFEFYTKQVAILPDDEMRAFHEAHCKKYDLTIDYSALLGDFISTNMLRDDSGQIAFRAKYTYCFFLAKHLANSIHLNDTRNIVGELSRQLFHEESANTIVFLAHLCSDPIVLAEMKSAASALFAQSSPLTLEGDVQYLEALRGKPATFRLPDTLPKENLQKSVEAKDDRAAQKDPSDGDGRMLQTHPEQAGDRLKILHELIAARKTIQILGQVLRNEHGAIEGDEKLDIVKVIFHLSRRLLGGFVSAYEKALPELTKAISEGFRNEMTEECKPEDRERRRKDIQETADNETRTLLWNTALVMAFMMVKHVSESVGLDKLRTTFKRAVESDPAIPNRIFDLAILFDHPRAIPKDKAINMDKEFRARLFAQALVRIIVVEHLYLYDVPMKEKQAICAKLEIELPRRHFDPGTKLLGTS